MRVNSIDVNNKPSFGVKIDGRLATDLCSEIYGRKLAKYMPAYVQQFEKLKTAGLDTSELYIARDNKFDTFMLKNSSITTAYKKPLVKAEKGKLLEAWFKITPEDIQKAESMLQEVIDEKRNGLIDMAKNSVVRLMLYTKNNEKDVTKAVQKMDDDSVIDLYYRAKDLTKQGR